MDLRRFSSRRSRRGISEVVGALLLMLVVVIAVGTFAYYLSNLQQQAETRNQFQVDVADEKLSVTNLAEFPSAVETQWQFTLTNSSNGDTGLFYASLLSTNPNEVSVTNGTDYVISDFDFSSLPAGVSLTNATSTDNPLGLGYYNQISNGVQACLDLASTPQPTIDFTTMTSTTPPTSTCTPAGNTIFLITFQSAAVDNINMTVMNLNTQESEIANIQLNNNWLQNWTQINQTGSVIGYFGQKSLPIIVPAKESVILELNVSTFNPPLERNMTLLVTLLSTAGNYFTKTFSEVAPFLSSTTVDEQFGQAVTSVMNFQATSPNSSSISEYLWRIDVPNSTWTTSVGWNNPKYLETAFTYGQEIQLSGNLLLQYFTTAESSVADLSQPMRITLYTLGTDGMVVQTASFVVPSNSPLGNPTGLSVAESVTSGSCASGLGEDVVATVTNSLQNTAGTVYVTFSTLAGNLDIGGSGGSFTNSTVSGVATAHVQCLGGTGSTGLIQVSVLDVNPVQFAVS
jgi:flagellin-like protein